MAAVWVAVEADKIGPLASHRPEEMNPGRVLESLVAFAVKPDSGGYLPGRVEVRDPELAEYLRTALLDVGVEVRCVESLPRVDHAINVMTEMMMGGPPMPAMLTGDGVTAESMQRFAEAATEFYRATPWKHLSDTDLIQIESPKAPAGLRCVTALGAAGHTMGLAFYDDAEELWQVYRSNDPAGLIRRRKHGAWNVTFNGIGAVAMEDADLWLDHGLPLAGEPLDPVYPTLTCFMPDGRIERARSTVLAFVTALLKAMARTTEAQIDSGRWTVEVGGPGGSVQFTLAMPDLLKPPSHQELMRRGVTPDRRAMERMHAQMNRLFEQRKPGSMDEMNRLLQQEFAGKTIEPGRFPARNALEQAHELCFDAFEAIGRRKIQLARKALATSPDCADAYVILAESTSDAAEAARLYAEGVAAGERVLGKDRFEKDAGHFWGIHDTRPYMRARLGLALALERAGREEDAIGHYQEMLRLNPGDNQGVRYLYLPLAMKLGRDAEAARYMKQSANETSANWMYTRALLAYRVGGASPSARLELRQAFKANPAVVPLLLDEAPPGSVPEQYSPGSEEEAIVCAAELYNAVSATPGAKAWLEEETELYLREHRKWERERRKKKRR